MGQQTERSNFTNGNSDDITKAVEGLDIFTKNYCMNCQKTEQSNDLVFRCSECVFQEKSGKCLIKVFANTHKHNYPMEKFGSMGPR